MNDRGLVDALRARDANALAELYDRYAESVYRYCWTLTGGPDGAQVALRDTMIAAEARIHALTDPARFKVWLYALARGECLRRRSAAAPAPETDPGDTGLSAVARDAVAALSRSDREILELVHRHGFSLADAARVIGISRRQARIRYGAAAERLFDALAAELRGRESQVFGLLPQTVLPESLRVRVMSCFADPDLLPYRRLVARRVGPLDASGFPVGAERRIIRGVTAGAASLAVALVVAFAFHQFWLTGPASVTAAIDGRPAAEPVDVRAAPGDSSTGRPYPGGPASSAASPAGPRPAAGAGLPTPSLPVALAPRRTSGTTPAAPGPRPSGAATPGAATRPVSPIVELRPTTPGGVVRAAPPIGVTPGQGRGDGGPGDGGGEVRRKERPEARGGARGGGPGEHGPRRYGPRRDHPRHGGRHGEDRRDAPGRRGEARRDEARRGAVDRSPTAAVVRRGGPGRGPERTTAPAEARGFPPSPSPWWDSPSGRTPRAWPTPWHGTRQPSRPHPGVSEGGRSDDWPDHRPEPAPAPVPSPAPDAPPPMPTEP